METVNTSRWPIARFPSRGQRQEFLEQVRIWNKVEGLPRIETAPMDDGSSLRFFSADTRGQNILRLIDAFGGFVPDRRACGQPFSGTRSSGIVTP